MECSLVVSVEDSDHDFLLIDMMMSKCSIDVQLQRMPNGDQALTYFQSLSLLPAELLYPQLVLLDINMPGSNGFDVLQFIKSSPQICSIPVVMFTSASNPKEREKALLLGAADYITKPSDLKRMDEIFRDLCSRYLANNKARAVAP